jgi:hypothetical protein
MMEEELGRARLPDNRVSYYKDQSVLILNQNAAPCAAAKCDSLLPLFQKSFPLKCIQERSDNHALDKLSSAPDIILVRPSASEAAQELIQSCKAKWVHASIIALLCAKWERLLEDLPSVLTKVDDFLPCPFHESELLLRVKRLLQRGQQLFHQRSRAQTKHYTSGALVGQSGTFVRAIKNIPPLAHSDAMVLLCGETEKSDLSASFAIIALAFGWTERVSADCKY